MKSTSAVLYQDQSISCTTQQVYDAGVKRFLIYRQSQGISDVIPPSEVELENFVSACADQGLGYSCINVYLCGLRHHWIKRTSIDILKGKDSLFLTLRGIKRMTGKPKQLRLPITTAVMFKLHSVLSCGVFGYKQDRLMWAAMTLAFMAGLRCGEFTVNSDSSNWLRFQDISFHFDKSLCKEVLTLTLRESKTDPFREGIKLCLYATGYTICAVVAMKAYLSTYQVHSLEAPLFTIDQKKPLTRFDFIAKLNVCLSKAGLNSSDYNGHSFRKGFATSASCASVPDHILSKMGRWKSQVYKSYVTMPASVIAKAQVSIVDPSLCTKF